MEKIKNLDRRVLISSILFMLTEVMFIVPFISRLAHNTILSFQFVKDIIYGSSLLEDIFWGAKSPIIDPIGNVASFIPGNGPARHIGLILSYILLVIAILAPLIGLACNLLEIKMAAIACSVVQLLYLIFSFLFYAGKHFFMGGNFVSGVFGGAIDNYLCFVLIIVNIVMLVMIKMGKELKTSGKKAV